MNERVTIGHMCCSVVNGRVWMRDRSNRDSAKGKRYLVALSLG